MNRRRWMAVILVAAFASGLAGCGSGSSGATYWRADFSGGTSLYMSAVTSGDNVSGWAKYGDGSFQHYIGTKNSDGTLDVTAYTGDTLSISGDTMTGTSSEGNTTHWTKVSKGAYTGAGGPTSS